MGGKKQQKLVRYFWLTLGLFAVWVLLSGQFEAKLLLSGFFASLIIAYICLPLLSVKNAVNGNKFYLLRIRYGKLFIYSFWLIWQIFKASVDVTKVVMKPHMDYEPRVVYFSMPFENPFASMVLANSIILTPGTITIDVTDDGIFEVHALTKAMADDLLEGEMARRVAELYDEACEFTPMPEAEVINIPKEVA